MQIVDEKIQLIDKDELGFVLDVVAAVLNDRNKKVSVSIELCTEFKNFCERLGKPYDTFEQMIGARLSCRWPAGACYLSELKNYKRQMLAELGEYLAAQDTVTIKELVHFLSMRHQPDFLKFDGGETPLLDCFNKTYLKNNAPAKAVIGIIERNLLVCKYIMLCAEMRDPVTVMKNMMDEGHSSLIDAVTPMFQLIAQQSNAPTPIYEKAQRATLDGEKQLTYDTIKRHYPDRKSVEKKDPYYFVLLKCPSCKASGNAVVRREDRGFCKCGQVFEIVRNMDNNQGLKDRLQEADEYVQAQLLEKLKKEFKYGFDELDAQMKDLASRISGMAVNGEYKRKALQLEYEMKTDKLKESTEEIHDSITEINRRIDQAVIRICDDHKQDILNLIEEQNKILEKKTKEERKRTEEERKRIEEERKENWRNVRVLTGKVDEAYGGIMDTLEMLNVLYDKMHELQQSTQEISEKTDEIAQNTRETKAMMGDMSALLAAIMGQGKKASAENRENFAYIQDFVASVMRNLADGMDAQTETIGFHLDKIMDLINNPPVSKYCCPWCKEEELTSTENPNILKCAYCGQVVSTQAYLERSIRIPKLDMYLEAGDWYYNAQNITKNDGLVVLNIPSNAYNWLRVATSTSFVRKDYSMGAMEQTTLILVSDFECKLNDTMLYKLFHGLGEVKKIIIGAGVIPAPRTCNASWSYNRNTKQFTRRTN